MKGIWVKVTERQDPRDERCDKLRSGKPEIESQE